MTGESNDPLSAASLMERAQRLRALAVAHETDSKASLQTASILSARSRLVAINEDVDSSLQACKHHYLRGWLHLPLRSRLSFRDTLLAAADILSGARPALKPLPPILVALRPPLPIPHRAGKQSRA